MHFPSGAADAGAVAQLESRLLYPKRGYQCLQFFYYNSAAPVDTLSIWVREYDAAHPNGTLRLIKTIDGGYQILLLTTNINYSQSLSIAAAAPEPGAVVWQGACGVA